ncbi:pollen-specific leucine-rich repeat extensin-like protein 3 [Iris pallida]|uniref:Pollen-specific leucine-rich repeat extensin-like protein 3 n=1 Tax=Iris pallida TaxID=29817 RepID=A0AAX6FNN9_IRIPA|nr:pollen-specific leucine-rich repeat extensin-like protein 3 [Iris pallida]
MASRGDPTAGVPHRRRRVIGRRHGLAPTGGWLCPTGHGGQPTHVDVGTGHSKSWWGSQCNSGATVGGK